MEDSTPDHGEEQDYEQSSHREDNFGEGQKRLIAMMEQRLASKVRVVWQTHTVRDLDLSSSMDKFGHIMNHTTSKSGRLYMDGCADTSVLLIN